MALKDWKKLKKYSDKAISIWLNRKKNMGLILRDWTSKGIPSDWNFPYSVSVEKLEKDSFNIKENILYKNFQTKAEALKFAKEYMRLH
jgi:hypothetical protein